MSLHVLMYAACYLSSRHVLMWLESGYFASTYPVAFRAWLFVVFAFGSGRSPKKNAAFAIFFAMQSVPQPPPVPPGATGTLPIPHLSACCHLPYQ